MFTNVAGPDDDRPVLLRIERDPAGDVELLSTLLFEAGATGIEERDDATMRARWLLAGFPNRLMAAQARRALPPGCALRALVEVPDDTWFDGWRAYARAQRAGQRLIVHPPWVPLSTALVDDDRPPGPDDIVLEIDPGRSFGSGAHPTTRLVLAELERLVRPGASVLDLGCGSGVLSIGAVRLGAGRVLAVDHDPAALTATRSNLARNAIPDGLVEVAAGLPAPVPAPHATHGPDAARPGDLVARPARFDVVAANIGANTLIALAPTVVRLAPTSILSGFFADRIDEVVDAYRRCDATLSSTLAGELDGWVALTLCSGETG
ncbi:MAG: 50S ribosomal protein L11 methyltransferase [Acidimicrobiia bacterium]